MAYSHIPPHHLHNEPEEYNMLEDPAATVDEIEVLYDKVVAALMAVIKTLEDSGEHDEYLDRFYLRLEELENTEIPK